MSSLTDADGDEAAHHLVDATINRRVGVDPILEEEAFLVGRSVRLFGHQPAQRHPGMGLQPAEAGEPGQGTHGLPGDLPAAARRPHRGVGQPQAHADAQLGQRTSRVTDTRRQPDIAIDPEAGVGLHHMHALRHGPLTVSPQHPITDGGPRVLGGGRSDNEPEVTCPQ